MFKLAVTVAILAVIVATLEARFVDKVASAVVARKISLDKLVPRVVRVLISVFKLAVKIAKLEVKFAVNVASAVCERVTSALRARTVANPELSSVRVTKEAVILRMVA